MNYGKEFKKYAMSDHNVSSSKMDYYEKHIENSMTPYILEERELRATQMDIFSRLMMDRVLWVAGPVNDGMSTVVQAQLMFLDSVENKDITMHIDSPGGSVKSGLSMVDVMDYIKSDIRTLVVGGNIIGAAERIREEDNGEFRNNVHLGAKTRPYTLSNEEKEFQNFFK